MSGHGTGTTRRAQWGTLVAFCLLVVATQAIWLSFAPVTAETARTLGVSEGMVGDLAVVSPLLFVVLALPAGRLVDRSFRMSIAVGAVSSAVGAVVRALGPSDYTWLMAGQLLASIGQPFVLTATTALAARCFPRRLQTAAITAASAAQLVGVLVGALGGGLLVAAGGLGLLLVVHAGLAVSAAVLFIAMLRMTDVAPVDTAVRHPLTTILRDPFLFALAALLFVGVGVFNALATWLDPLMTGRGHPGTGGPLLGVTTVAGVVGAAVLPTVAATRGARRGALVAATAATAVIGGLLGVVTAPVAVGVLLAILGAVLLAGLPIALDWSEIHVGAARAGTATGALLLAGNLGGVVLVLALQPFVDRPDAAFVLLGVAGVAGFLVALRLPRAFVSARRTSPVAEPGGA